MKQQNREMLFLDEVLLNSRKGGKIKKSILRDIIKKYYTREEIEMAILKETDNLIKQSGLKLG